MINKQAFLNSIYQNIDMVRGDTLTFNFQIQGLGTTSATFAFLVAENFNDAPLIRSDSANGGVSLVNTEGDVNTYTVNVRPQQTSGLDVMLYHYDLVMYVDDNVYTLMRGDLNLLNEVERG